MKAYLEGGPANGRVIPHPNMYLYIVPVSKPVTVISVPDPLESLVIPTATYQFTGQATVNLDGKIRYMLYRFIGQDS
jgi:hypothetical protein